MGVVSRPQHRMIMFTAALLAAPPTQPTHDSAVATVVLLAIALYLLSCLFYPWKHCVRCHDAKKFFTPFGHSFRLCPRCQGKGKEFRVGVRIFRWLIGHGGAKHN